MPIVTAVANAVTKPMPRMMSPKAHAVADYLVMGSMALAGLFLWRRNRRAAAGAELATNLLTDYPGGAARVISYRTHGEIDIGLAAMMATMPEFMGFHDEQEKQFFLGAAGAVTAVSNLTDFRPRLARSRARRSA